MLHPISLDPVEQITEVPTALMSVVLRHCHIDEDTLGPDAQLVNLYMLSALQWFEKETKRSVIARSHRWALQAFPCENLQKIRLPGGKTQSVQSIQYVQNGQTFTLTGPSASPAGSDFQEELQSDRGGIIQPLQGEAWPVVDIDVPSPVVIHFIGGWTVDEIPSDALLAMLFYVSDCNELRGTSDISVAGEYLNYRNSKVADYALRSVY